MSNAQRLYLQHRIGVKLSRDAANLRRTVGHLGLLKQLQPLLDDMDRDFLEAPLAVKCAVQEGTGWLAVERYVILRTFETRLQTLFSTQSDTDRFADLTQQRNVPHTLLQPNIGRVFKLGDTITEE